MCALNRPLKKATKREIAYRIFSFELVDTQYEERGESTGTESAQNIDEGITKIPNFVITPTGLRANRVLIIGKLIAKSQLGERDMWKCEISDGLGTFYVITGAYQGQPLEFVKKVNPPEFVFLTGKIKTYQPDNSNRIYISIRPEIMTRSNREMYYYWLLQSAKALLRRIDCLSNLGQMEPGTSENLQALGFRKSEAENALRAKEHYGINTELLERYRELAANALRIVTGEDLIEIPEAKRKAEQYPAEDMDVWEGTEPHPSEAPGVREGAEAQAPFSGTASPKSLHGKEESGVREGVEPHPEESEVLNETNLSDEESAVYEIIKSFDEEGVNINELADMSEISRPHLDDIIASLLRRHLLEEPEPDIFRVIQWEENEEEM